MIVDFSEVLGFPVLLIDVLDVRYLSNSCEVLKRQRVDGRLIKSVKSERYCTVV